MQASRNGIDRQGALHTARTVHSAGIGVTERLQQQQQPPGVRATGLPAVRRMPAFRPVSSAAAVVRAVLLLLQVLPVPVRATVPAALLPAVLLPASRLLPEAVLSMLLRLLPAAALL